MTTITTQSPADWVRTRFADQPFLDLEQTAEVLGLSIWTVRAWVREGRLPVVRLAERSQRVPVDWLADYIDASYSPAQQ